MFDFRDNICKLSDIEGVYQAIIHNVAVNMYDVKKVGAGTLCGRCSAKRKAIVTYKQDGILKTHKPWTDEEERWMWGRLKNKMEFGAFIHAKADTGQELVDQQREVSRRILRNGITISRERCVELKLNDWIERIAK